MTQRAALSPAITYRAAKPAPGSSVEPPTAGSHGSPDVVAQPPAKRSSVRDRTLGLLLAAAPTVAYLTVAIATGSLAAAIAVAAGTALAAFGWRVHRKEPLRKAVPGVLIVAVCAGVAAITGQTRGFFLVPTLIPFAVIALCLGTIAIGRPLTGILLNRLAGGPKDWTRPGRLRRVYIVTTLAAVVVNIANGILQVAFYRADDPVVLGAAHVATGPVFAGLVAVTVVFARRAIVAQRATVTSTNSHHSDAATRTETAQS